MSTTVATASAVTVSAARASVEGNAGWMPNGNGAARRDDTRRKRGRSYGEPTY